MCEKTERIKTDCVSVAGRLTGMLFPKHTVCFNTHIRKSVLEIWGIHILGIMPALHVGQKSSILLSSTKYVSLAQLAEFWSPKPAVRGSSPWRYAKHLFGYSVMVTPQTLTLLF